MRLENILSQNQYSEKIALVDEDKVLTYRHWWMLSKAISNNIKSNSKQVGIFLPNGISFAIAYFAILYSNKTIVPLETDMKQEELLKTINYCDIDLILTDKKTDVVLKKLLDKSLRKNLKIIFTDDVNNSKEAEYKNLEIPSEIIYDKNDIAVLIHTSGTTSNPKRVMITHQNLISNIQSILKVVEYKKNEVSLIVLPLYLSTGHIQFLIHLYIGATIIFYNGLFVPNRIAAIIKMHKITNLSCVSYMLKAFVESKVTSNQMQTIKIITVCAGKTPKEILLSFLKKYPDILLYQGYGQTEASPRITHLPPKDLQLKSESIGLPLPGIQIKLINEKGEDCNKFELGELYIKGNNVMRGYFKNEEATNNTIIDGWLRTGDILYEDNDGYLYIVGRKKNIIISGGQNLYPEAIEEVLCQYRSIKEAFVFGEETKDGNELIIANIVVKNKLKFSEDKFWEFCHKKLKINQIPKQIHLIDEISKTANGKLIRK